MYNFVQRKKKNCFIYFLLILGIFICLGFCLQINIKNVNANGESEEEGSYEVVSCFEKAEVLDLITLNETQSVFEGTGTSTNPYIIENADQFYFISYCLTNSVPFYSTTQICEDKYFLINNDLEFNDGYLDKTITYKSEGNNEITDVEIDYADGEDGKLYNFAPFKKNIYLVANEDVKLKRMYCEVEGDACLFNQDNNGDGLKKQTFKNIHVENCFMKGENAYGLGGRVFNANNLHYLSYENCSVDGTIVATGEYSTTNQSQNGAFGFVGGYYLTILTTRGFKNCINYSNCYSIKSVACGFALASNEYNVDCVNYGDIYGKKTANGFFNSFFNYSYTQFKNLTNYGNITSITKAAGISCLEKVTGNLYGFYKEGCINCVNCGTLSAETVYGVLGEIKPTEVVSSCANYGTLIGKNIYGLYFKFINYSSEICIKDNIVDCDVKPTSTSSVVYGLGTVSVWESVGYTISNCVVRMNLLTSVQSYYGICENNADMIINCINYTDMSKVTSTSYGICRYNQKKGYCPGGKIINCKNYGYFAKSLASGICYMNESGNIIKDCQNYGNGITANRVAGITISNAGSILNCENYGTFSNGVGIAATNTGLILNCANHGKVSSSSIAYTNNGKIINCLNDGKLQISTKLFAYTGETPQNCICDCFVGGNKVKKYQGNDFSAFYCSWRDESIGLKALNNTFFQGTVNVDKLTALGFSSL